MRNLVLLTQVAITIMTPIFLGLFLGLWIDGKLDTKPFFTLVLIVVGVLAGFLNAYKLIVSSDKNKKGKDNSERN